MWLWELIGSTFGVYASSFTTMLIVLSVIGFLTSGRFSGASWVFIMVFILGFTLEIGMNGYSRANAVIVTKCYYTDSFKVLNKPPLVFDKNVTIISTELKSKFGYGVAKKDYAVRSDLKNCDTSHL